MTDEIPRGRPLERNSHLGRTTSEFDVTRMVFTDASNRRSQSLPPRLEGHQTLTVPPEKERFEERVRMIKNHLSLGRKRWSRLYHTERLERRAGLIEKHVPLISHGARSFELRARIVRDLVTSTGMQRFNEYVQMIRTHLKYSKTFDEDLTDKRHTQPFAHDSQTQADTVPDPPDQPQKPQQGPEISLRNRQQRKLQQMTYKEAQERWNKEVQPLRNKIFSSLEGKHGTFEHYYEEVASVLIEQQKEISPVLIQKHLANIATLLDALSNDPGDHNRRLALQEAKKCLDQVFQYTSSHIVDLAVEMALEGFGPTHVKEIEKRALAQFEKRNWPRLYETAYKITDQKFSSLTQPLAKLRRLLQNSHPDINTIQKKYRAVRNAWDRLHSLPLTKPSL